MHTNKYIIQPKKNFKITFSSPLHTNEKTDYGINTVLTKWESIFLIWPSPKQSHVFVVVVVVVVAAAAVAQNTPNLTLSMERVLVDK